MPVRWFAYDRRDHMANRIVESNLFKSRAMVVAFFGLILMLVLVARLYHLQLVDYDHYITQSTINRVHLNAVEPARGLIFDRNGEVLAHNLPSFQLEITEEDVENMEETLQSIGSIINFTNRDIKRFRRALKRAPPFQGVPLKFSLTEKEVALFSVERHNFPGVDIVASLKRHYPNKSLAGHTIGYVGRISEKELETIDPVNYRATRDIGKTGIEKQFESILHGEVGYQQVEVNVAGRVIRVLEETAPIPGEGVYLTLDVGLQKIAEGAIVGENGAVVAIDPRNGEILALLSKPDFDINLFVDGISVKNYAALRDDWRRPLFNRAVTGTYPPGSTIKPILALAALENHTTTKNSKIYCPGYFRLPNEEHKYRDWKAGGHGFVNLDQAITQSCDVMFYDVANKLGIDKMEQFLAQFGFGKKTKIDLSPEHRGILPSKKWKQEHFGQIWYPGETLIAGIGQGYFIATPLQLAQAMSVLAMPDETYKPHLLYARQPDASDKPEYFQNSTPSSISFEKKEHWQDIIDSMIKVTSGQHGTARNAFLNTPYSVAGKTGTAQVFSVAQDEEYDKSLIEKRLQDHALFVGFAPADKPEIAVAVIVENGGSGGSVAAPIARRIMDAWLGRGTK